VLCFFSADFVQKADPRKMMFSVRLSLSLSALLWQGVSAALVTEDHEATSPDETTSTAPTNADTEKSLNDAVAEIELAPEGEWAEEWKTWKGSVQISMCDIDKCQWNRGALKGRKMGTTRGGSLVGLEAKIWDVTLKIGKKNDKKDALCSVEQRNHINDTRKISITLPDGYVFMREGFNSAIGLDKIRIMPRAPYKKGEFLIISSSRMETERDWEKVLDGTCVALESEANTFEFEKPSDL